MPTVHFILPDGEQRDVNAAEGVSAMQVAMNAGITLHVTNHYGANNHHIAETCFKAVARALRFALERDPRQPDAVPSTKGSLKG